MDKKETMVMTTFRREEESTSGMGTYEQSCGEDCNQLRQVGNRSMHFSLRRIVNSACLAE
ncbi:hypothetical protein NECAME_07221 [Necator americanus]|uniref:Uncharacterized protein n=1 Tax=Necator americanus TaxID=51031 RepID=W2TS19_NECAM|nr:hypothetical protein NECAME_07221 [Necator americanus]ETN83792.1 hypothetical protein NECAME_07221 [Necator americanus]